MLPETPRPWTTLDPTRELEMRFLHILGGLLKVSLCPQESGSCSPIDFCAYVAFVGVENHDTPWPC